MGNEIDVLALKIITTTFNHDNYAHDVRATRKAKQLFRVNHTYDMCILYTLSVWCARLFHPSLGVPFAVRGIPVQHATMVSTNIIDIIARPACPRTIGRVEYCMSLCHTFASLRMMNLPFFSFNILSCIASGVCVRALAWLTSQTGRKTKNDIVINSFSICNMHRVSQIDQMHHGTRGAYFIIIRGMHITLLNFIFSNSNGRLLSRASRNCVNLCRLRAGIARYSLSTNVSRLLLVTVFQLGKESQPTNDPFYLL